MQFQTVSTAPCAPTTTDPDRSTAPVLRESAARRGLRHGSMVACFAKGDYLVRARGGPDLVGGPVLAGGAR